MIKLKIPALKAQHPPTQADSAPALDAASASSSAAAAPAPKPALPKLKLNVSQPPTPSDQSAPPFSQQLAAPEKKKRTYQRKDGSSKAKKRSANDDSISPAAKRAQPAPSRKISLKLAPSRPDGHKPKLALSAKRKPPVPKLVGITHRGKAPPRPTGVGYDSEDSDVERDPAIQQALILRMEDGEDADYLRQAIADGRIGPQPNAGDAEVSLKFIEKNYRRAIVKIRGRLYAAVLVDIPCIVESMKSFDKKGWWKVADIAQMLLVLGRCQKEEEAKTFPLPREVSKDFQYAHGLTPPMHWVRKRRFRKRVNYNEIANVEEEVERLLRADDQWIQNGGTVLPIIEQGRLEAQQFAEAQEEYEDDEYEDAEGEAIETVETDGQEYEDDEEDMVDDDLEARMQAEFDLENEVEGSDMVVESPAPIVDQAASLSAVENTMLETPVSTPVATGAETQDEESDEDESDEDEEDSPDAFDEDAVARAAELAQQREEVQDLEREVERARQKVQAMTNQLLRQREMQKLAALEEDLKLKKSAFGLDQEDED